MNEKTDMEKIEAIKILTCSLCGRRIEADVNRELFGHCSVGHLNETRRRDEVRRANPFGRQRGAI
jgi:hypothetical protein